MSDFGEPWSVRAGPDYGVAITGDSGKEVAGWLSHFDGEPELVIPRGDVLARIAACVNFLAGVPTENFAGWPPLRVQASMSLQVLKGQFQGGFPDALAPLVVTLKMLASEKPDAQP
jgi:hypothetical protein